MKALKYIPGVLTGILLVFGSIDIVEGQENKTLSSLTEQSLQAGVNKAMLNKLIETAPESGLSDEALQIILGAATILAEQNLPSDAVLNKALEGISKNITSDRIVLSVESIKNSTEEAADIVDAWTDRPGIQQFIKQHDGRVTPTSFKNDLIVQFARGLSSNVREETYSEFLTEISKDNVLSRTSPVNILAAAVTVPELSQGDSDKDRLVSTLLKSALKNGFGPSEIQQLPVALDYARRQNQNAVAMIMSRVSGQPKGGPVNSQELNNFYGKSNGGGPPGNLPVGLNNRPVVNKQ